MRPRGTTATAAEESAGPRAGLRRIVRLVLLSAAGWLAACGSPPSWLVDIPASGKDPGAVAVTHPPRRTPAVKQEQVLVSKEYLEAVLDARNAGPPPDWPAIYQKLPKDDEDNIDWMQALRDKVIAPRPGIDPDTPETKIADFDVTLSTSGKPERAVEFSHLAHGQWLSCSNCHPAIFEKDAGSAKITMAAIDDGKFCGVCHDKIAVAMPASCKGCHKPTAAKAKT